MTEFFRVRPAQRIPEGLHLCAPEVRGLGWLVGVVDFGVMVGGFGAVGGGLEGGKLEGKRKK